jgi:hypothetical protein
MENLDKQFNSWEEVSTNLREKINVAKEHALTIQEAQSLRSLEKAYAARLNTPLSSQDVAILQLLRKRQNQATVVVQTLPEAREVLELLKFVSKEQMNDTLDHENAHVLRAFELGAGFNGYNFILMKDGKGNFGVTPMSDIEIPADWSPERRLDTFRKINDAPEYYGNELSEDDKETRSKL